MRARLARGWMAAATGLRGFVTWWLGELAGMLPSRLAETMRRRGQRIVLETTAEDRLTVFREVRGQRGALGSLDLAPRSDPAGRLAALLRERRRGPGPGGGAPLCLRLTGLRPLRATLSLPLAAEENLREAILFELDRAIPLRAAEVWFGYAIGRRDRTARRIQIAVTAVRRAAVDTWLARLGAVGIVPDEVVAPGGADAPDQVLLVDRLAPPGPARRRRLRLALGVLAGGLALAAALLPLVRAEREQALLARRIAAARHAAETARQLRLRIEAADAASRFLRQRKQAAPPQSVVLAALARILPDGTWLTTLRIDRRDVRLTGFSHASSALIGRLERSGLFHDTRFAAPTTQDSATGLESFSIATTIRSGGG